MILALINNVKKTVCCYFKVLVLVQVNNETDVIKFEARNKDAFYYPGIDFNWPEKRPEGEVGVLRAVIKLANFSRIRCSCSLGI